MDKLIVERAVRALAALNGSRLHAGNTSARFEGFEENEACRSHDCAECYDVGDRMKIHRQKVGEVYRAWLERWKPKGRPQ